MARWSLKQQMEIEFEKSVIERLRRENEQLKEENEQLKKRVSDLSWYKDPDRMGGF